MARSGWCAAGAAASMTLLAAGAWAGPPGVSIVRGGRPVAVVVLSRRPSRAARFAAQELVEHVRRMTGATLRVRDDRSPVRGPRILVGESAATRLLGLRSSSFAPQERLVRAAGDTLTLLGRDAANGPASPADPRLPGRAPGRYGRALRFEGERMVASAPAFGFPDDEGTMEAWVNLPEASPDHDGTILRLDGDGPWTYHILQRTRDARRIIYQTYDGATVSSVTSAELAPGWRHLVATHSVSAHRVELFVDGVSQGTAGFNRSTCRDSSLGIGGLSPDRAPAGGVGNPFTGLIDEVRIRRGVHAPEAGIPGAPRPADATDALTLHCDEAAGPPMDWSGRTPQAELPGFFEDRGTLDAVYDFLDRRCGVSWYLPGEAGAVIPRRRDLTAAAGDLRRRPGMAYRWITPTALFVPTPAERVTQREVDLWKLRVRLGGLNYNATHSFYGYYDRFLKSHPEWFAQGYTGQPPQLCYSNPALIAQVVQDARDYFNGKGMKSGAAAQGDYFALVPMDNNSWCRCARCQSRLNAAEATNPQFNNGKASDYIWSFVNAVAREVRKTHPRKWIAALAYSDYAHYPTREPIEPNVAAQLCLHVRNWWCPSMEANDRRVLGDFTRDRRRPVYLWLYYNFPALQTQYEGFAGFPSYFARTMLGQMGDYRRAGIRGLFIEHSSEFGQSHLIDLPDLYLTLRLADDPSLDGRALLEAFFHRFYGAAGSAMRRAYGVIEEAYSSAGSYPEAIQRSPGHQHQTEALAWGSLGTPARMAALEAALLAAKLAARPGAEAARVALFERGIIEPMRAGAKRWAERSGASR